jgi:hypothetical protein
LTGINQLDAGLKHTGGDAVRCLRARGALSCSSPPPSLRSRAFP